MRTTRTLFRNASGLVAALLACACAHATEADDVTRTMRALYTENEKALLCYTQEEGIDPKLINVPEKYFSRRFMAHYRPVCLGKAVDVLAFDLRTGDRNIFALRGYRPDIRKLAIGQPRIDGAVARVTVTYDLEEVPFEAWGNFTKYRLVKEDGAWKIDDLALGGTGRERESTTGMPTIPSLVRYIDAIVARTHAAGK